MQRAPDDERPARAMPEAAQHHGDQQIHVASRTAVSVAPERHIEIVAQEARQCDVPAVPEVDDAFGPVRRREVDRQANTEQQASTDGHVGVTGEVEVELRRVGQCCAPRGQRVGTGAGGDGVEEGGGVERGGVGQHHFLRQADRENGDAEREGRHRHRGLLSKLSNHFAVVHDRAGDELGEEGHEQRVVDEVQPIDRAPVRVHEEGDLLEREERDANRQHDLAEEEVEAGERVEVVHEEVGILEVAQRREVEHDAEE